MARLAQAVRLASRPRRLLPSLPPPPLPASSSPPRGALSSPRGLSWQVTASLLPASTTTGLALTMPSGLPLIRAEWVAVGTAFNSATTQVRGSDGQTLPHTRMRVHSH